MQDLSVELSLETILQIATSFGLTLKVRSLHPLTVSFTPKTDTRSERSSSPKTAHSEQSDLIALAVVVPA
jgi:hypothetical protein